jgi:hypothetical protein
MTENIKLFKSVADPHNFGADTEANLSFHFNAHPDPTFHFDADPNPTFILMQISFRIRILFFVRVIKSASTTGVKAPSKALL